MKYAFKYYVHDTCTSAETTSFLMEEGLPKHIAEKVAKLYPFYEVTLHCEYDDDTNEVTMKAVEF